MRLDFVSRHNEKMSPLIYCWEETDSTYYAEKFFLLLPREYVVEVENVGMVAIVKKIENSCWKGKCDD